MIDSTKRLFFALDVMAPWPELLPMGRIIEEQYRHLTLAFLGKIESEPLVKQLSTLPKPKHQIGIVGKFDQPLFLPPRRSHVAAWNIEWLQNGKVIASFQHELLEWLEKNGFPADHRHDFLPHVTIARSPFSVKAWRKSFHPLPLYVGSLHLFESLGNSRYASLWQYKIQPPFEEFEHVADIGFRIYATSYFGLFLHAQIALAFSYPNLTEFISNEPKTFSGIEEVVATLNQLVCLVDQKIGSPFKAVSYHGKVKEMEGVLQWEMIIDV